MINQELNDKLRAKFNPDGSPLRNYQMRLLEILKFIDKVCKENNIKYWLSSGTCLGAVRHGGFIPWDDDADVEMFEEDYKRFILIMKKMNHEQYVIQTNETDRNYHYSFGKVRDLNSTIEEIHGFDANFKYKGIFIDIFPISPSNSKFIHSIAGSILWKMRNNSTSHNEIKYKFWSVVHNISFPILRFLNKLGNSKTYRHTIGQGCPKIRKFDDIKETTMINFEGYLFPIPVNSDHYLKLIYGNYMILPDVTQIQPHLSNCLS